LALVRSACAALERFGRPTRWSGLNKEIKRRTNGVFPNPTALLRLAGSVLVEAYDEWQVADKRYYPKPPWRYSTPSTNHSRTLPPQRLSRHSENPQSLRRNAGETPALLHHP
jgi:Transposase, Mutator family